MWDDYRPRRTADEMRRDAEQTVRRLKIDGIDPRPVTGIGKSGRIANSFWGHGWCRHLEQHCDYESRLPRGRSYVRNGAVVHLNIDPGEANALVLGTELYELSIRFDPLPPEMWAAIQSDCRGKIGSLIELLQGRLSQEVMARVTDPKNGLFPRIGEMHFNCNCLDWADMCKHVAAVLYGIGARLDSEPELLFRLRGVNHAELIGKASTESLIRGARKGNRRRLEAARVREIFGIEPEGLENGVGTEEPSGPVPITGPVLRSIRESIGLNKGSFGRLLGVSATVVDDWEGRSEPLPLAPKQEEFLREQL